MAIKIYGDKIVFPDNTEQTTAPDSSDVTYTKEEIDAQQEAQDTEIAKKLSDAPEDGEQYVRKDGVWAELAAADGGIADAPADGKTYGRKDLKWEEVTSDAYTESETDALLNDKADKATTYTKTEVDASQSAQDTKIDKNTTDIATNKTDIAKNTVDIAQNTSDIAQNTSDIESLNDDIDALTGSVIYKGSLNATVIEAPLGSNVGDMWINEYNVDEPATNYPVASGWSPVTEVKFDDKLIKTDTGWDKIESVVGVPSYTAGEIDELLDDKADKTDVYTKTEIDTQQSLQDEEIDTKADIGDSYLKAETYNTTEVDDKLDDKADTATTYTKTEVDESQDLQDVEIAKKADKATTYTKDEIDELIESASGAIVGNYTNKWADSVARDPEAGNLYLVYGMNFSSKYDEVTKIYISDTDGDGEVRDFDEVKENDKIKLSSENGSGEYTIVGISDVGGYRELILNTESSDGTIANDSAVSVVLDVASSGESGGIEEAPADGKQYARQDEAWTEVEASGSTPTPEALVWENKLAERGFDTVYTNDNDVPLYVDLYFDCAENVYFETYVNDKWHGTVGRKSGSGGGDSYQKAMLIVPANQTYKVVSNGTVGAYKWYEARMPLAIAVGEASSGGEAQPPVAFKANGVRDQEIPYATVTQVEFYSELDTDNGFKDNSYTIPKDGIYSFSYSLYGSTKTSEIKQLNAELRKNGARILSTAGGLASNTDSSQSMNQTSNTGTIVVDCKKDEEIALFASGYTVDKSSPVKLSAYSGYTSFSGHMVSSITEGEVKEKEAVVFRASPSTNQLLNNVNTIISLSNVEIDTDNAFVDGKFKPSVAGYYQLEGFVNTYVSGKTKPTLCIAYLVGESNGTVFNQEGTVVSVNSDGHVGSSIATTIMYFNGTTDFVRLWGTVSAPEPYANTKSYLTAHLITGQSSGGGSDTTREVTVVDTAIGMVAPFAMDSVPTGWLHCDGSEVSRSTYSLLYSKVGDTYGAGDGSTTFNLPDLQDEFIRGSSDTLAVGNKQDDAFQGHSQYLTAPAYGGYFMSDYSGATDAGAVVNRGAVGSFSASDKFWKTSTFLSDGANGEPRTSSETRPRNVAMLYCINATAEPSSGGGEVQEAVVFRGGISADKTLTNDTWGDVVVDVIEEDTNNCLNTSTGEYTPNVEGYYLVSASTLCSGTGIKRGLSAVWLNDDRIQQGTESWNDAASVSGITSNTTTIVKCNGTTDSISVKVLGRGSSPVELKKGYGTKLNISLITGQSSGGGSGGSYTPEKMVWNDVTSERAFGTEYTNTNDVPLYVQLSSYTDGAEVSETAIFSIDDVVVDSIGAINKPATEVLFSSNFYIVPSGSKYKFTSLAGGSKIDKWNEAKMPVAVATGGKTVAFRGTLANDISVSDGVYTSVDINSIRHDTDNALTDDGKFKPSVAGYYQVSGVVASPTGNSQTVSYIYRNRGEATQQTIATGTNIISTGTNNTMSPCSGLVYLDGKEDFIELGAYVKGTNPKLQKGLTYLSAVLVSGGSASGDSIVTQEGTEVTVGDDDVTLTRLKGTVTANKFKSLTDETTDRGANVYMYEGGTIVRTTATTYTAEETETAIDKKLAIKDKLIEKLSARLDELEKKVK